MRRQPVTGCSRKNRPNGTNKDFMTDTPVFRHHLAHRTVCDILLVIHQSLFLPDRYDEMATQEIPAFHELSALFDASARRVFFARRIANRNKPFHLPEPTPVKTTITEEAMRYDKPGYGGLGTWSSVTTYPNDPRAGGDIESRLGKLACAFGQRIKKRITEDDETAIQVAD